MYQQGEASPTLTLYDLATDINPNATESDLNKSNWTNTHGSVRLETTMSSDNSKIESLKHDCYDNTQSGNRTAGVSFGPSTNNEVYVNFNIKMTSDIDGANGPTLNHFSIKDNQDNIVLDFKSGYNGSTYGVWINDILISNDIITGYSDTTRVDGAGNTVISGKTTPVINITATINFSKNTMSVTAVNNDAPSEIFSNNFTIGDSLTNVAYIESTLHRSDGGLIPSTTISNLVITQDNTYTPVITPQGDDLTLEVGESISIATVIQYDKVELSIKDNDNEIIDCEFAQAYSSVVVTGKRVGKATVTVTAYNYNGGTDQSSSDTKTDTKDITVTVTEAAHATTPPEEEGALSSITPTEIVKIDFDNYNDNYKYFDEYGRTHSEEGPHTWTTITSVSDGLTVPSSPDPVVTSQPIPTGHLSGNAFYSHLTPENGTQTGNGYRGSFLELDNSLVQRTDKIKVSYDFAFYNIVKDAGGTDNTEKAGIPLSISMASEAEETSGIPYSFNSLAYDEVDADPSDLTSISKHLLTFMTGRPKRDSDGVHFTDMTNRLAYYDPLYGEYRAIGNSGNDWELAENEYNYFHVEAEVDFYNDLITFTITDKRNEQNNSSFTATTVIPEHSSWNGFIIGSNKWDNDIDNDINGQDTEHYAYLDNITAEKTALDDRHIIPAPAPTEHPIPTDAVILKNAAVSDTEAPWIAEQVHNMVTPSTAIPIETETVRDESTALTGNPGFTYDIVTGAGNDNSNNYIPLPTLSPSADGITSYTEFDFYLPKEGSKLTLYMTGSRGDSEVVGNTITISTAGINSWYGNKNYQSITDNKLDCGIWYSMQIVYDLNDTNMRVIVTKQSDNSEVANATVRSRGLSSGYYRALAFNPESITTGDNGEEEGTEAYEAFPVKEPSMALTYIANLRIYNRATIEEYYPEGATTQNSENVTINNREANSQRLGAVITNFVRDQVEGGANIASDYERTYNYPVIPPKNDEGKTFKGWKLIYSNGEGSDINSGTIGENATRIKYAAVYDYLDVESAESSPINDYYYKVFKTSLDIMDPNYTTIDWFVYNNDSFRMVGRFDLRGLPVLTGDGTYDIGYVVYNIPVGDSNVTAIPQAHHVPMTNEEKEEITATPLPSNKPNDPGTPATSMPQPSNAPTPSSAPNAE